MEPAGDSPTSLGGRGVATFATLGVATLAGLVASAMLVVDYMRPAVYCGGGSGCDRLKLTTYAAWASVPTPIIGIVGFAFLGALTLFPGKRARATQLALGGVAAAFAAFLIFVQVRLGIFCKFCLVTDSSALVFLGAAAARFRAGIDLARRAISATFATAMAIAAAAPIGYGFTRPLPTDDEGPVVVPETVKREIAATPAGHVTVVDYVDFECPFCRMTHEVFSPILDKHASHLRVVRKQVPLTKLHPHAMDAALAACCGERLGKEVEMANALFSAPADDLTSEGCEAIATKVGLDATAFRSCMKDPATQARVEKETADFRSGGGRGLPTIWIGEQRFVGAQDPSVLEAAILRALKERG
jgi:protein-disulfide isomerase